jgi:hypothetical protein
MGRPANRIKPANDNVASSQWKDKIFCVSYLNLNPKYLLSIDNAWT